MTNIVIRARNSSLANPINIYRVTTLMVCENSLMIENRTKSRNDKNE